ncbi:MAG: iron ABC transporter permease [Crenarchaeota archaeon]|nr:iron ABC transporter permease [Thermoproteota archaeon]
MRATLRGVLARLRIQLEPSILVLLAIPLFYYTLFFLAPLGSILIYGFGFDWNLILTPHYFNLAPIGAPYFVSTIHGVHILVLRGVDLGVVLNSLVIAAAVTLASTVLGVAVALLTGLYDFPGRRIFAVLAFLPLLIAPFVNMYVIRRLYGYGFELNTFSWLLSRLGIPFGIAFDKQAGVIFAQTLAFYPIVYVNVVAALGALDATLVEQALNLGSRGFKLLRTIILPLIMPGILAGAMLVYILSLEDVAAPIIFNFKNVMAYQIYYFFQSVAAGVGKPYEAAALSIILLLAVVAPLVVVRKYLSLRYYARLARGAPRPLQRIRLGRRGLLAAYLLVLPIAVAAAAPQIGVVVLAFAHRWTGPLPNGVTLNNYVQLFAMPGAFRGIINSVEYTLASLPLILIIGFATAYVIARLHLPGMTALDALATLPLAIPGLVVAFGYFVFLHNLFRATLLDPLVYPGVALVIAYAARKSPFTVRSVYTGVISTPPELEEAAKCLGSKRSRVIRTIVIPLVWKSMLAGLLLSAIYVLSEVSVSITIGALGGDITSPNHAGPITFVILRLIQAGGVVGGTQPQAVAAAMATILMALEAIVLATISKGLLRRGQALVSF